MPIAGERLRGRRLRGGRGGGRCRVRRTVVRGSDGRWSEGLVLSHELLAPEIVLVEATNILRRLERNGVITSAVAASALDDVMVLDLVLYPYGPCATRVWELRQNLTAYDAWYVAVAEASDLPLATLDSRLLRASGPRCEFRRPRAKG